MKSNPKQVCRHVVVLLLAALCPGFVWATDVKPESHPELSAQEQYIACSECHKEATPDVYQQWFDSRHGLDMVKCYQCHGTFETFRKTPTREVCATCHEKMMKKCPQNKPCWSCHVPHGFKVKKEMDDKGAVKK